MILDILHKLKEQIHVTLAISAPVTLGKIFQRIEPDGGITADLDLRKFRFQQLGGHFIKFQILFPCAGPHDISFIGGFRFVPNLPVFHIVMKTVCPAFGIMADHARTDLCPFQRIFRRIHTVGFAPDFIFNGHAQTVIGFDFRFHQTGDQWIGPGEIVRCRIFRIRIEIGKYIGNIHKTGSAETAAHIV